MKCSDVQDMFGTYWDLAEYDLRRAAVDEHIKKCSDCAEIFAMWKESAELIQGSGHVGAETAPMDHSLTNSVMSRIYADEAWRLPVAERVYSLTYRSRFRLNAIIAFCLALFVGSFIYSVINVEPHQDAYAFRPGVIPVLDAVSSEDAGFANVSIGGDIPVASVSAPFLLKMGPIQSYPDYLVVVSILGVVFALLTMNWLSRVRS